MHNAFLRINADMRLGAEVTGPDPRQNCPNLPFCYRAIWPGSGCLSRILSEDTLHGGCRDAVPFGDLAKALALTAVVLDGGIVQLQRFASDLLTLEAGAPH